MEGNEFSRTEEVAPSPEITNLVESTYKDNPASQTKITITLDEGDQPKDLIKTSEDQEIFLDVTDNGKKHIVTNFAHGNEPYRGSIDTAITVNNELEAKGMQRSPIIVPLVYPGRQERIIKEEFPNNLDEIYLVPELGDHYREILFENGRYDLHLPSVATNHARLQDKIWEFLARDFNAQSLATGDTRKFNGRDTAFSINYGSRFITSDREFYAFPALLSRILEYAKHDEELARLAQDSDYKFDFSTMDKVQKIAETMEKHYTETFIPDLHTFSGDPNYDSTGQTLTPPLKHPKTSPIDIPEQSIYVMASGTGSQNEAVFKDAQSLGLTVYRNPFIQLDFGTAAHPDVVYHPNVVATVARGGWGTEWDQLQAAMVTNRPKPLLIPGKGYVFPDDFEIKYNMEAFKEKGLGIAMDGQKDALEKALALDPHQNELRDYYLKTHGTTDGIEYMAKRIILNMQKQLLRQARITQHS